MDKTQIIYSRNISFNLEFYAARVEFGGSLCFLLLENLMSLESPSNPMGVKRHLILMILQGMKTKAS